MESLAAIYLYALVSGVLISIFFGMYIFMINLVIIFCLCATFCSMSSYGFLYSVVFAFAVIASNQFCFLCGVVYKHMHVPNRRTNEHLLPASTDGAQ